MSPKETGFLAATIRIETSGIVEQRVDLLEDWPGDDREIQSNVPQTIRLDPDTETYRTVGIPTGTRIYLPAGGTDSTIRFKIHSPCFHNLSALLEMARGEYVADLIASLGRVDR